MFETPISANQARMRIPKIENSSEPPLPSTVAAIEWWRPMPVFQDDLLRELNPGASKSTTVGLLFSGSVAAIRSWLLSLMSELTVGVARREPFEHEFILLF
jgi:hypothetical protein